MADFVDLKCPCSPGYSRGVADLAAAAARYRRMPSADITRLYRAGLVHGLGRLGVSNQIWEKKGPLSTAEWERAQMYPYLTGAPQTRMKYFQTATRSAIDVALLGNCDAGEIPLSTRRVKSSCDCHPRTCAQETSKQPVASRAPVFPVPYFGSDRIGSRNNGVDRSNVLASAAVPRAVTGAPPVSSAASAVSVIGRQRSWSCGERRVRGERDRAPTIVVMR